MRALITGGAGFVGSHLAETLLEKGHRVTIIDDLSTGSFGNIEHLIGHSRFRFVIDSITNEVVLDRITSESDVIFHLAAAVGVKLIVDDPVHTIETNIMGTESVLKTALRYRAKVLLASTSEVYGKGNRIPFAEEDDVVLGPTSRSRWAYAASKMVDEFLGFAYFRQYGLPVIPFRLFNTVGPRQTGRYGMVIPRFVRQALKGDPITIYGDGNQRRCFCDVRDVVPAIIGLAEHTDAAGRLFNIGGTEEITIRRLAERVKQLSRSNSELVYIPYDQVYNHGFEDMERRLPDTRRVRELLDWKPTRSLDETLEAVLAERTGTQSPGAPVEGH